MSETQPWRWKEVAPNKFIKVPMPPADRPPSLEAELSTLFERQAEIIGMMERLSRHIDRLIALLGKHYPDEPDEGRRLN